jgi:hypothetical protein
MHGKIRGYPFQLHWSNSQIKSEAAKIVKTIQIYRFILVLRHLFWADVPCIELESTRGLSYGSATTPSLYIQEPLLRLVGFCID